MSYLSGRSLLALLFWCALYFLTGYISLYMDAPVSRVAVVWFPAGVAVSAFLIFGRGYWPMLFLALFLTRVLLDVALRHTLETSLALSAISLANDLAVAWCVRYFAAARDQLRRVGVWLLATLGTSVISGVLGGGWLALRHEIDFVQTVWMWWASNVVGTILLTTILMGLLWRSGPFNVRRLLSGGVLWLLLCLSAWYVFHQPVGGTHGTALQFALACLPVMLMIAIPVMSGNRFGAFAFLCFSIIVIYYSWQRYGPFFIPGLRDGEPLLLAQCYLSATALLLSFVYVQKRAAVTASEAEERMAGFGQGKAAYHLEPQSGRLTWDENIHTPLSQQLAAISNVEQLFALLSAEDSSAMQQRWQQVLQQGGNSETFRFHLALPPSNRIAVSENRLLGLRGPAGVVIVGYWSEEPHSKVSIHSPQGA
ncbi:MASE1 domain-containing protein [Serratia rhizosphaerae]|uniref:MASE1 domain-containing protein n=1 Tax=Serratia rhizosphaerae TaxID=2597702 RepID=A0ABX6GRK7_9GAMM|nr:MASE1 domain-containing protein [Serratia rhizosphaerae]MEB6336591.1 MASE1 domain-containing protein [Serratia rhizosphaerae]QHA88923.1 hypothetical protein FO014_19145 [Serratia rhizosphaerae]